MIVKVWEAASLSWVELTSCWRLFHPVRFEEDKGLGLLWRSLSKSAKPWLDNIPETLNISVQRERENRDDDVLLSWEEVSKIDKLIMKRKERDLSDWPWFKRRLELGRILMNGPSFWYSASNSDRYWLSCHKQSKEWMNRVNQTQQKYVIRNTCRWCLN